MTSRLQKGIRATANPARSGAVADLFPRTASRAVGQTWLDKTAETLVSLALVEDPARWQAAAPSGSLPLWQEDLLLLELLPLAVRILGQRWADDEISFVDVSIATVRLQEVLRRYGVRASRKADVPAIPVILPPWEQHSFAAALAAHRVSRAGHRALMLSGMTAEQLVRLPIIQNAGVMLIATCREPIDIRLRQFRKRLLSGLRNPATLISGGPGFDATYMDTGTVFGAFCSTNDPVAALKACGIQFPSTD